MKLFWRENISLLIFNMMQLFFIILIFWLDGSRDLSTILYAMFFGSFLLTGYLIFHYLTHRAFYRHLSIPLVNLDESLLISDSSPVSQSLQKLMQAQYHFYQEKIHKYENKQQQHIAFINRWVHQMKTPLSVIYLILKGKINPIFESIREEIDRLGKGLEIVLHTSRLDNFEHDFHVELVSLQSLVNQVIFENKRFFIRSKVYPEIKVDADIQVTTDAKWLSFILSQLITNAIRYSAGISDKIIVSAVQRGRERILEVSDKGVGIPKQDINRVFEPYFTGENGRKYGESTGMGLYLVHEVCKKLHHEIEIESEVEEGTIVRIIFSTHR